MKKGQIISISRVARKPVSQVARTRKRVGINGVADERWRKAEG
jgi:hypothetical protein